MSEVEITVAEPAQRAALENLLQLYVHDFSEHWRDRPLGDLNEDGRFDPYRLDLYWENRGHVPLLLRVAGRLVGFALLDGHSHAGGTVDRNMAEFFVVRKHRRGGVGMRAAQAIFSRYPGVWEAAVARRNLAALHFWRKAVAQHPDVAEFEETDLTSADWDGPVIRFRVDAPRFSTGGGQAVAVTPRGVQVDG